MSRPITWTEPRSTAGTHFLVHLTTYTSTRRICFKNDTQYEQQVHGNLEFANRPRQVQRPPGSPPYSHVGLLRKFILFAYDPQRKSVVIGPTLIRAESQAPRLLEHGGEAVRRTKTKTRRLRYRPRPFMGPAYEAEKAQLPALWKNSVR